MSQTCSPHFQIRYGATDPMPKLFSNNVTNSCHIPLITVRFCKHHPWVTIPSPSLPRCGPRLYETQLTYIHQLAYDYTSTGAGTHLKVGGTGPARKWGTDPAQSAGKNCLVVPLHFFGYKSAISPFRERFREFSFGQFIFCCFSAHGSLCPAICKSGGTCPRYPTESAPLYASHDHDSV